MDLSILVDVTCSWELPKSIWRFCFCIWYDICLGHIHLDSTTCLTFFVSRPGIGKLYFKVKFNSHLSTSTHFIIKSTLSHLIVNKRKSFWNMFYWLPRIVLNFVFFRNPLLFFSGLHLARTLYFQDLNFAHPLHNV